MNLIQAVCVESKPVRVSLPEHLPFDPSYGSHGLYKPSTRSQEFPDVPNVLKKQIFAGFCNLDSHDRFDGTAYASSAAITAIGQQPARLPSMLVASQKALMFVSHQEL